MFSLQGFGKTPTPSFMGWIFGFQQEADISKHFEPNSMTIDLRISKNEEDDN